MAPTFLYLRFFIFSGQSSLVTIVLALLSCCTRFFFIFLKILDYFHSFFLEQVFALFGEVRHLRGELEASQKAKEELRQGLINANCLGDNDMVQIITCQCRKDGYMDA